MSRGRTRQVRDDDDIEMREGRPEPVLPFSMLGDWVMLALQANKVRHPALSLYWALCAHLNANRAKKGDRKVWPTQDTLAEMLGYSEGKKIKPYLRELVAINAIEIITEPVPGGGYRVHSYYVIHKSPPPDYDGPESLQDFYDDLKARQEAARAAAEAAAAEDSASALGDADQPAEDGSMALTGVDSPGAEMSPRPGAEMSPRTGGRNEPLNKTKKQDEGNEIGGADRLPPKPPADLTAGRVDHWVTSQTGFQGDQQTAGAETGAAGFDSEADDSLIPADDSLIPEDAEAWPPIGATSHPVLAPSAAIDGLESHRGSSRRPAARPPLRELVSRYRAEAEEQVRG
ncbi:hypothetical protein [Nocardia sp. NPDC004711]